ncbi:phage tail domain-containing protein [Clostridium sp. Marseille-Q2269]|uniref:phage distal tail protein n=1 Tax=Clostridium sp. Marseille-Q2269 TaxID=2942205 RepID=UPI0020738FB5|nr:phage tail domain-containing protein [Clostridium sp. Marseille-Q2269]
MECSIKLINLKNKEEINVESDIKYSGILCTKFNDNQTKGEFSRIKGVNQIGQSINSSTLSVRDISLGGVIIGEDRLQVEVLRKQLVAILNPLEDVLLKYTEDYIEKEIIVRAANVPIFSSEINNDNLLSFLVSLDADYPLWQDQEENVTNIETWEGGFEFEFEIPTEGIEFARKGPDKIEVLNNGQIESPLEFYFKAPALNPKIILNSKEYIKVNKKINEGEILYICTAYGKKRVEIIKEDGTRENAYGYIDIFSKFFKLPVGKSIISYSTEGDFIPQSVILKYKNQYLSL